MATPPTEGPRLRDLDALRILDTPPEAEYDDLCRLAALLCDVPIAQINFIDATRQWQKASLGLPRGEDPRAASFCAVAIERPYDLLVVEDARVDPRFRAYPNVTGEPRIVFYAGAPLVAASGAAVGTLCIVDRRPRELTVEQREGLRALARQATRLLDLRLARDEARSAAEHRARFLAAMSHELRTPLNGVLGVAELLAATPLGAEQREWVATMQESGEHLLRVVDDVLDLDRLDAGRLDLEREPLEPARILRSAAAMLRPRADAKGLALDVEVAPGTPERVLGDATRLRQILLNLGGNAVKFTDEGRVLLRVESDDDRLVFTVSDTGPGLPSDVLSRLFEPYRQADASVHRTHGGSGLGLSISRRLATLMGGTLDAESRVGQGSVFSLRVPLSLAPAGADAAAQNAARPEASGRRVLVVEDSALNRKVAAGLLARLGCDVVLVPDGEAAVAAAAREPFDLVLMDLQMPGIDGFEAARRLRALPVGRALRIVACTAHALPRELAEARAAGMDDAVSKPLRLDALARVLTGS